MISTITRVLVWQATATILVQSKRAVEIETLKAQAEVEPLLAQAEQLRELKENGGSEALQAYTRNSRLSLYEKANRVFVEVTS